MASSPGIGPFCRLAVFLLLGCRDVKTDRTAPLPNPSPPLQQTEPAAARDLDLEAFQRLFRLSEAGEAFISDNVISNETSLLEPAALLGRLRGGAYIGVGPEQNFTYIALSRPEYAILVDLRRDNALLHLLYKALFELASSRLEFTCLLLGRPYAKAAEPAPNASIDELIAAIGRAAPDQAWHEQQHQRLIERLNQYQLGLTERDVSRLRELHQLFFERQLDLRFELRKANARSYPTLGQLLQLRSADGIGTFLASSEGFDIVQRLQRRHRIVPVVGDVSAQRPLATIADELRQRGLAVRTFYISNVEQYLVGQPSFRGWLGTLERLPHDEQSIVLRCYLDQGRSHPRQQPGSRTTTLAQSWEAFLERSAKRPYPSFFKIVTDESLDVRLPKWL